ncbi:MAG: DUF2127 domain-containing protein [Candidatus Paceibacterota bacterium]
MEQSRRDAIFRKAFFATVIVNGCIALADLAAGCFFLFKQQITAYLYFANNPISRTLQSAVTSISSQNQMMGIIYFFSHGLVKLILVWGLLTNRLWAYPFAVVLLSGFTLYQLYDIIIHFSFFTLLLLTVNLITIFFISREYRQIVVQ